MAYLSAAICVSTIANTPDNLPGEPGPALFHHHGQIPSREPVDIIVEVRPGSSVTEVLDKPGVYLIAGELRKHEKTKSNGDRAGDIPVVRALVCSPGTDQLFLNEVSLVGRTGSDAKEAASGKSSRIGVAVNRFYKENGSSDIKELTDWYGCRGFGFTKEKLDRLHKGSLVEIQGCLAQLTNRDDEPYCEVRVRSVRSHGKGGGGGNRSVAPASDSTSGSRVAGYDEESFEEDPAESWD